MSVRVVHLETHFDVLHSAERCCGRLTPRSSEVPLDPVLGGDPFDPADEFILLVRIQELFRYVVDVRHGPLLFVRPNLP